MRLVTSIYEKNDIDNLDSLIDYALINVPHLSINFKDINLDELVSYAKSKKLNIILSINRIMHPGDLKNVEALVDKYNDLLFLASDIGVLNIFKEKNMIEKLIYNPETMITNYLDLGLYNDMNLNAIGVSSEITIDDLKLMYEKTKAPIYYQGFGHRLMFYSRRKLLTLYSNKNNDNYPHEGFLKEITREDYLPIIENSEGTLIYRSYLISLLKELEDLSFIKYLYIESFNVNIETFKKVSEIFYDAVINGKIREGILKLNELNLDIEDGFMYKDSVYQKEELKWVSLNF